MAITPYLLYRDAGAAVEWLTRAFGLRKIGDVFKGEDGRVNHASMTFGKAVADARQPGPGLQGAESARPRDAESLRRRRQRGQALRAEPSKAGATIIEEPKDTFYGARRYGAEDLEGHRGTSPQDLSNTRKRAKKARAKRPLRTKKAKARGRKRSSRK